ncbi:LOW QUALITY PROTEIN: EGF-like repeat and discoidin I-like domain-containing protein 3, partial [Actinia tenebrosa]|uniref:LOW QUALITY PROTEIN: EGF-like repeat and discoidin I-like domain-containing protein 3 n=1 Tax=Actinia tenebrosa TaxID=6105 RepID=A0A6P8H5J7_ACTTE
IYLGNHGYKSLVRHHISPAIYARYVRFLPVTWNSKIGIRVELYGCREERTCSFPVGLEDGRVNRDAITASSVKNTKCTTNHARLNSEGAWCPNKKANQWLQIHLPRKTMIMKIATQGNQDADQWITSYRLSYGLDGKHWNLHRHQEGKIRVFSGNADRNSIVIHKLFNPFQARYVRFLPKTWHGSAAMRVEVYGCHDTYFCRNPLGLEDGRIRDGVLDSSTHLDVKHGPTFSRLFSKKQLPWCTAANNTEQWLQIDLRITKTVTKIALRGSGSGWVKSYALSYSVSESHWVKYQRDGRVKTFLGNYDANSVVYQEINPAIHARFVRIQPCSWRGRICLRTELYGCLVEEIGE